MSWLGLSLPHASFVIPALAVFVLVLIRNYRVGATINICASAASFLAALCLLFVERSRTDLVLVDDFNIYLIILTTFVAFTTSVFSATYIAHEVEIGRLLPTNLRFYHAMYQAFVFTLLLALAANNLGLMWVAVEGATLATALMV